MFLIHAQLIYIIDYQLVIWLTIICKLINIYFTPSFRLHGACSHICDMAEISENLNSNISEWAILQTRKMQRRVNELTLKDRRAIQKSLWAKANEAQYKPLAKSIGVGISEDFGQVSRINFRLVRHGIFFERGVGKGRKASSGKTIPHPFIRPVLDPAIDELADLIASNAADSAVAEIKFVVPGILSRRIKITNNG